MPQLLDATQASAAPTVQEVAEFMAAHTSPRDYESVLRHANVFLGLFHKRSMMRDIINEDLQRIATGAQTRLYSQQSFALGSKDHIMLRANVWAPERNPSPLNRHEDAALAYEFAHNHNFHMLTFGFAGPGYRTSLYRLNSLDLDEGSPADLVDCGDHALSGGRAYAMEAFRDVHVQHRPRGLSVSINLVCADRATAALPQFSFDIENRRAVDSLGAETSSGMCLLRMASLIGRDEFIDSVTYLRDHTPSPRIKAACERFVA